VRVSELPISVMCFDSTQMRAFWEAGFIQLNDLARAGPLSLHLIDTTRRMGYFLAAKTILYRLTLDSELLISLPVFSASTKKLLDSEDRLSIEGIVFIDPDSLALVPGWGAKTIGELREKREELLHTVFDLSEVIFEDLPTRLSSLLDLQSLSDWHVDSAIEFAVYCRVGNVFKERSRQYLRDCVYQIPKLKNETAKSEYSSMVFLDLVRDALESVSEKENTRSIFLHRYAILDRTTFRTLEDLGHAAVGLGFATAITRARVSQIEKRVGNKLFKLHKFNNYSLRALFPEVTSIISAHRFFAELGFKFHKDQSISFRTFHSLLRYCGIQIEWTVIEIESVKFILFDGGDKKLQQIINFLPNRAGILPLDLVTYHSDCTISDAREIISQIPGYSILETADGESLVWKNIGLRTGHAVGSFSTGNQIYTTLLRVFALVKRVDKQILSRVFTRTRNSAHIKPLDLDWLDAIIDFLPDFEAQGDAVIFVGVPNPKRVSRFDMLIAQLVLKVGRIITSDQICRFMTSHGVPHTSVGPYTNLCLLLDQSVKGMGGLEGKRRFITAPSDIRLEMVSEGDSVISTN
jgi:hypothetical protein